MTLARLTERLQEEAEKGKVGRLDGRRFNKRSQMKMTWEMRNITKSIRLAERKKKQSMTRGTYTKEELKEYRKINEDHRQEMRKKMEAKENEGDKK